MAVTTFEHVALDQIDPNVKPLPTDDYNLQIVNAASKSYVSRKTGESGERIDIVFSVVGGEHAGRRVYAPSIFPGDFGFRTLRRLSDFTGISAEGLTVYEWLSNLVREQGTVRLRVEEIMREDRNGGDPVPANDIKWGTMTFAN